MRSTLALTMAALALTACASPTETIYLAKGTERVQCGPYKDDLIGNTGGVNGLERRLRQCVEDYQKAGFQRVPGSN
jgi:hypothetical protein